MKPLFSCAIGTTIKAPECSKHPGALATIVDKGIFPMGLADALVVRLRYENGDTEGFDCSYDPIDVELVSVVKLQGELQPAKS
jgi:hypothetical protein